MSRLLILLLILVPPAAADEVAGRVKAAVERQVARGFAGVVLVAHKGRTIYRAAHGLADASAGRPNTPEMLFDIGSVTKPFTAAAVVRLAVDRVLKLDDRIGRWLPGVPADKRTITVAQLLSHTSGLTRRYEMKGADYSRLEGLVSAAMKEKLTARPGARHEYSNLNYFLLAAIVQRASRMSFEAYLRKALFDPAGMKHTGFCQEPALKSVPSASRHEGGKRLGSMWYWAYQWGHRGATGIVSTADDLLRWHVALNGRRVLPAKARALMFTPVKGDYALGWSVSKQPGGPQVQMHGGAAPGASAMFTRYPEHDAVVIVLCNHVKRGEPMNWWVNNAVRTALFGR